jgi:hypothetical protein
LIYQSFNLRGRLLGPLNMYEQTTTSTWMQFGMHKAYSLFLLSDPAKKNLAMKGPHSTGSPLLAG